MKYIPELHTTKLDDGGYILHEDNDVAKDVEKYNFTAGRLGNKMRLLFDDGVRIYMPPYKYSNWLYQHFPLTNITTGLTDLEYDYDDLPEEVKSAVVRAEKHLFIDRMFENFSSDQLGFMPDEWENKSNEDKDMAISQFQNLNDIDKLL